MNKICSKCQEDKPLEEFATDKRGKFGKRSDCKKCNCVSRCQYQKENLSKVLIKNEKWRQKNQKHYTQWQQNYAPRRRALVRNRYNNDSIFRNSRLKQVQEYRNNPKNKIKIRTTQRKLATQYRQNPQWRLIQNLRRRLSFVLHGQRKADTSQKLIGCTWQEVRVHLERQFKPNMSWENYGKWHVDHIKPCYLFDLSDPIQQRACFHFSNLQPLWAKDNFIKGKNFNV
jgi:hypothetical protein